MNFGRHRRAIAVLCACAIALVAGGSVWCEPLCAPPDAAVPSCHAAASQSPSLAELHDCSTHSLAAFTLESANRIERVAAPVVVVAPAIEKPRGASLTTIASAENTGPPQFAPHQSIRVLRI